MTDHVLLYSSTSTTYRTVLFKYAPSLIVSRIISHICYYASEKLHTHSLVLPLQSIAYCSKCYWRLIQAPPLSRDR